MRQTPHSVRRRWKSNLGDRLESDEKSADHRLSLLAVAVSEEIVVVEHVVEVVEVAASFVAIGERVGVAVGGVELGPKPPKNSVKARSVSRSP